MSLYCFANARLPEQRAEMERLAAAGICLFCPEHLAAHQRVVFATGHWQATINAYPYAGTSLHLMLIPNEHVDGLLALSDAARADFWLALAEAGKRYGLDAYGLGARNGDCRRSGATIAHLHVHLLVADDAPDAPPVRMRFSR